MTKDPQQVLSEKQLRAILVGALLPHERVPSWGNSPLEELHALAKTAGIVSQKDFIQNLHTINPTYYIGAGKAQELSALVKEIKPTLVIFDNDLSPSQVRNLEKLLEVRVMDRTELILEIFALHAQTNQSKLQVQLAQMEYTLPRLRRMWSHLERIDGQLGAKGPGEKQLELDRRMVRKKIFDLKKQLKLIQQRKEREVKSRKEMFTLALVGYTNAGKSTLMNQLTHADVLVEDKLFATLDTRTRVWKLPQGRRVLLSDTVGFISKIPPHLIASFHATLEEVTQADLLIHVVDLGNWAPMSQIDEVNRVLETLKCQNKKTLLAFNKVDLLSDPIELNLLKQKYPEHVVISAKNGQGIDELSQKVFEIASQSDEERELVVSLAKGKLLSFLEKQAKILYREYRDQDVYLRFTLDPRMNGQFEEVLGENR